MEKQASPTEDDNYTPSGGNHEEGAARPVLPLAPSVIPIQADSRRSHIIGGISLIVILVISIAVYAWIRSSQQVTETSQTTAADVSVDESDVDKDTPQTSVPRRLLEMSGTINGMAVGYVREDSEDQAVDAWLFKRSAAQTVRYSPVIFYKNTSARAGDQLFSYDVSERISQQITDEPVSASTPVFSSVSQKLAFVSGGCSVAVQDIDDIQARVVQAAEGGMCYQPIAWSPDGQRLAFAGVNNDLNAADWSLLKLYIWQPDGKVSQISIPATYNSVNSFGDVAWIDTDSLAVRFIHKFQGSALKERMYSVQAAPGSMSPLASPISGSLSSIQTVGTDTYFINRDPRQVMRQPANGIAKPIANTRDLGGYMVRMDDTGAAESLIIMEGMPGTQDTMKLSSLAIDGTDKTLLVSPKGYSAYLLGWGNGYDQVIYMAVLSGKSELRLFDMNTRQDSRLVADLPLIQ